MYPSLHVFLSSERYRKEETTKIKATCGNMTRPGSDRDAHEYRREENGVTDCAGGDRHYLTQSLNPWLLEAESQGSMPGYKARAYLNPLSREMHLASC